MMEAGRVSCLNVCRPDFESFAFSSASFGVGLDVDAVDCCTMTSSDSSTPRFTQNGYFLFHGRGFFSTSFAYSSWWLF